MRTTLSRPASRNVLLPSRLPPEALEWRSRKVRLGNSGASSSVRRIPALRDSREERRLEGHGARLLLEREGDTGPVRVRVVVAVDRIGSAVVAIELRAVEGAGILAEVAAARQVDRPLPAGERPRRS